MARRKVVPAILVGLSLGLVALVGLASADKAKGLQVPVAVVLELEEGDLSDPDSGSQLCNEQPGGISSHGPVHGPGLHLLAGPSTVSKVHQSAASLSSLASRAPPHP